MQADLKSLVKTDTPKTQLLHLRPRDHLGTGVGKII